MSATTISRSILALLALALIVAPWNVRADDGVVKGDPLSAKWEYSTDGGKTFSPTPPTITATRSPDERKDSVVARAAFDIADPDKLGLVKFIVGDATVAGAAALTDADSVDRYNVGTRPNLLKMRLAVNGQETDAGMAPYTLYRYVSLDPKLLKKGPNSLTVSGVYWFQLAEPTVGTLRLETYPASVTALDRLPVLGAIGEDHFTVAARSICPAEFTVTARPLDPPGDETRQKVERSRQMKARVPLAKGTRKFQYSVTVHAGGASKTYGPYEVRMPIFGEGFRFAVLGNTAVYGGQSDRLKKTLVKILDVHPDVFIHTGRYVECTPWDFKWTTLFFGVHPETFARIPILPCCGLREMGSPIAFRQQFYFPGDDKDFGQWTTVFGDVRFVALETWSMSQDKQGESLKWLDKILGEAREKYIVVLNPQVTHCSTPNAGRAIRPICDYVLKNVNPLLVKHKATVTVGGHHTNYERSEPPAAEGITTIMTCMAGGSGKPLQQVYVDQNKNSRATYRGDHFVLFEVKKDKLVMQAMDIDGKVIDTREFSPRR